MAKLRPGACYRKPKRPYTRVSRYRELSYVKGVPGSKVRKFDMGSPGKDFDSKVEVITKESLQIRHNALEAFRMSANSNMLKKVGRNNYHFKLKTYPHQIIRHNPTANFAGADRFSSGMKHSFGKPLGRAAVVKRGQVIGYIRVDEKDVKTAKKIFKTAVQRLPCKCSIKIKTPE
ncbi:50S ribosomal protein L16 [archaeon]|nr:50S ribosomal protein L16 [archaeon]